MEVPVEEFVDGGVDAGEFVGEVVAAEVAQRDEEVGGLAVVPEERVAEDVLVALLLALEARVVPGTGVRVGHEQVLEQVARGGELVRPRDDLGQARPIEQPRAGDVGARRPVLLARQEVEQHQAQREQVAGQHRALSQELLRRRVHVGP
jgi:hypothetical protein